jgi:hypothetical protein
MLVFARLRTVHTPPSLAVDRPGDEKATDNYRLPGPPTNRAFLHTVESEDFALKVTAQ